MSRIELLRVKHGSNLYGTNGPLSDIDYKVVVLPDFHHMLLGRKLQTVKERDAGPNEVMQPGDTETEFIPLHTFLHDFFSGQTYAIELYFAWAQGRAETIPVVHGCSSFVEQVMPSLGKFLHRGLDAMVGYAVSQSKLYGLKTERYTSLHEVETYLKTDPELLKLSRDGWHKPLKTFPEVIQALLKIKNVSMTTTMNGGGGTIAVDALDICGKMTLLTSSPASLLESVSKTLTRYGNRVKAYEGEGVDWKALSHAIRITEQITELATTGKITFPRPNAGLLRDIKEGKYDVDYATNMLNDAYEAFTPAIENGILQAKTPELCAEYDAFTTSSITMLYAFEAIRYFDFYS